MNKYYDQIDKALKSYETLKPWHPFPLEWIGSRIDWCWKWRKISEAEMTQLVSDILKYWRLSKMKSRFEMFMDWIEQALPYGYITTQGDIIYVHTSPSVWRFNKTDMARFGKITLFHQSENHLEKTGELKWHKQIEMRSGYYTLFYCFVHDKFKGLGLKYTTKDYQSLTERFERWYGLQLIKEYLEKEE